MAKQKLEQRTQGRFVVALPLVKMNVLEYAQIPSRGGRIATTSGGAVSQYVFEKIDSEVIARTILANLRDKYGGVEKYAMRVPDNYSDEKGKPLRNVDKRIAEEIEVASYFAGCYGGSARNYLDETREILQNLALIRRRMNKK